MMKEGAYTMGQQFVNHLGTRILFHAIAASISLICSPAFRSPLVQKLGMGDMFSSENRSLGLFNMLTVFLSRNI
ncbi:unnamed protein product [Clavelina lepadiformis]|uniref:Uncharacterized protein n=1 Tax=Clavelina lepadiformis TaxID=159417 RepID=A0ABP0F2E3_CLALP